MSAVSRRLVGCWCDKFRLSGDIVKSQKSIFLFCTLILNANAMSSVNLEVSESRDILEECRGVGEVAQSFMTFRQMGMSYDLAKETLKSTTSNISDYMRGLVVLEKAFEYSILANKNEKQSLAVYFSEQQAGECLMGYIK